MRSSRVFRLIWRVNAVVILLAGLGVLWAIAGWLFVSLGGSASSGPVSTAMETKVETRWSYGRQMEQLAGSDYAMVPLNSEEDRAHRGKLFGVSMGTREDARNYLFLNLRDQSSRFLMADHQRLFTRKQEICGKWERPDGGPCVALAWLEFESVAEDSNRDGHLGDGDRCNLGFSNPDGTGYQDVLTGVDGIKGRFEQSPGKLMVVYTSSGKHYVSEIDIPGRRIAATKELPEPGAK